MAFVSFTSAVAGQVATASFYNNNNNALASQFNGNVDSTNLANLAVTTTKINTGAVTGVKIAMGSDAQGDILFRGASNYQRLAAGTSGFFLMTQGTSANPVWSQQKNVQVVNLMDGAYATGTTAIPVDDTIPQNTEGTQFMSLAITPSDAANKLRIDVVVNAASNGTEPITAALFQDSTADSLAAVSMATPSTNLYQVVMTHYMTAGTASATTFKVRVGGTTGGATYFNGKSAARIFGGVMASSMTITEIKA